MLFIKLEETTSTNDFLKSLSRQKPLPDFTVVSAESQSDGRGQMGAKWISEKGKNLMMSMYVSNAIPATENIFDLNIAVAMAVITSLEYFEVPDLAVKWPNDIMSGNKKLGGILIENTLKSSGIIETVIGLGLNVNQQNFKSLPKASSIRLVLGRELNRDELLEIITRNIVENLHKIKNAGADGLWVKYDGLLFMKNQVMSFRSSGEEFSGIIEKVTRDGKLVILVGQTLQSFNLKEVEMLY